MLFELAAAQPRLGAVVGLVEAQGREPLRDHALGVALLFAGDAEQVPGVGLVERVEARAGEQLAQQARGLGGFVVVEVDLGRPDPGLRVVRVGLAPAPVGLERLLGLVLLARQRRLQLDHGRVVRRRLAGAARAPASRCAGRPPRAPPKRRRAGVRVWIESPVVGHAATLPRGRGTLPRPGSPSRPAENHPPHGNPAWQGGASWRTGISPGIRAGSYARSPPGGPRPCEWPAAARTGVSSSATMRRPGRSHR